MNLATIEWFEVVWTAAALPGLALWLSNHRLAIRSLRAVRAASVTNGRLIIARYSVLKANVFIGVSGVFVLIGIISMTRPTNPAATTWDWTRTALTLGLLGAPAAIAFLGYKWRAVERQVTALYRRRLDAREVDQNSREVTQNSRETEQNDRDKWQDGHGHE
jgi:hypothetical protein